MRLLNVRLNNITCFEDLSLDFRSEGSEDAAPWIVLLGENGTGKSTILQMIGAILLGSQHTFTIAGHIDWKSYIRYPKEKYNEGQLWTTIVSENSDVGYAESSNPYTTYYKLQSVNPRDTNEIANSSYTMGSKNRFMYTEEGWFACGYSPWRRLSKRSISDGNVVPTIDDSARPYRFASLFGDSSSMTNVADWFAGLYVKSIFPGHSEDDIKRFETAQKALLQLMPHIKSLRVTPDQQVLVQEKSGEIPLERLSDGYRGTLAWVGDLIRRLFDAYPNSENPLHEHGVVLVDEIDLHLHPRWQRTIVQDIRKLFPNLQFIVTTHSPFIAQGLQPQDKIIVLERSGKSDAVIAREDIGALESWSADQILSAYFGLLNGTRGEKTQRREKRYECLLDLEATGKLTEKQRQELNELEATVDKIPVGDTPSEEAVYRAAEDLANSLRQRRLSIESKVAEHTNQYGSNAEDAEVTSD